MKIIELADVEKDNSRDFSLFMPELECVPRPKKIYHPYTVERSDLND